MLAQASEFKRGTVVSIRETIGFAFDDETHREVFFFHGTITILQKMPNGLELNKKPYDQNCSTKLKRNDRIAYIRTHTNKGYRTEYWCFEKDLDTQIKKAG